jgi:hypothetical protein
VLVFDRSTTMICLAAGASGFSSLLKAGLPGRCEEMLALDEHQSYERMPDARSLTAARAGVNRPSAEARTSSPATERSPSLGAFRIAGEPAVARDTLRRDS